jgi:hypothetical protein
VRAAGGAAGRGEVAEGPPGWAQVGFDWGTTMIRGADGLSMAGVELDGDQLLLLHARGFRWISERPHNAVLGWRGSAFTR